MKTVFSRIWIVALLVLASAAPASAGDATQTLSASVDKIISLLAEPAYKNPATRPQLRQQLVNDIQAIFDMQELSRRALGAQWKNFSPDQQTRFVASFGVLLQNTYLDKIESYTDEKVSYLSEQDLGSGKIEIATKVVGKDKEIPITYRLIDHNGWKVYDVVIEGVSLVQNYRSQFGQILMHDSPDTLIAKISAKKS